MDGLGGWEGKAQGALQEKEQMRTSAEASAATPDEREPPGLSTAKTVFHVEF